MQERQYFNLSNEIQELILKLVGIEWQQVLMSVSIHWYNIVAGIRKRYNLPIKRKSSVYIAVRSIPLLKWALYEQYLEQTNIITSKAAVIGKLNVIQWALENGITINRHVCNLAAKYGHLDIVKWTYNKSLCVINESTCANAALNGHLDILIWLYNNNCKWNSNTCNNAAKNGHLKVLKWACLHGCSWDKYVGYHAAQNGHLEILEWLRAHGYAWTNELSWYAAYGGQQKTLRWLRKNGCPPFNDYIADII